MNREQWLALREMAESEEVQQENLEALLEEYSNLCDALSRNDPNETSVWGIEFPMSYGRRLGTALLGNQHVSKISIPLDCVLQQNEVGTESANSLLDYIRGGTALRELVLHSYRYENNQDDVVRVFVEAASSSQCLQVLHMALIPLPTDMLLYLLHTTKSVLKLTFNLDLVGPIAQDADVALAFGANTALENLVLFMGSNNTLLEAILRSLGSHCSLKVLELYCSIANEYDGPFDGIAALLAETACLQHLELGRFSFNEEGAIGFLEGLQANRSLTKLSMSDVLFQPAAQANFIRFFQTASTSNESTLRELSYTVDIMQDDLVFEYTGEKICSMLSCHDNSDAVPGSTRGTLIETVHLDSWEHENFIETLRSNASAINLPSLRLARLRHAEAWSNAIPSLVHLRQLHFTDVRADDPDVVNNTVATLVAAVRKNGSLHVLGLPTETMAVVREKLKRLLQAFLLRNKMVPELLAKPRNRSSDEQQTSRLPKFPTIFAAALPVETFALHNVVTGLLSASEDIGY